MRFRKIAIIGLSATILLACLVAAQNKSFRADGNKTKSYIEYLASDQLEGRQTLTPGYQKAADYVAAHFKEWGLKPSGDGGTSYFQKVPISSPVLVNVGTPALAVDNRAFSFDDNDFTLNALSTAKTSVKAEVVFVGYGLSLPAKGLDEYAGFDVKGKIVLAYKGSPETFTLPRGFFNEAGGEAPAPLGLTADEVTDNAKIKTAYDKGAAAILLYDPNPAPTGRFFFSMGGPQPTGTPKIERNFLAFDVTERVFKPLMRKSPLVSAREFGKILNTLRWDIRNKKPRSKATGGSAVLKGYDRIDKYSGDGVNVIGKIEGTDPVLRDQFIVLGGHLDHLGTQGAVVMNGADDDASGAAVVMEAARVLSQGGFKPKRTIIFAAWCGEELGLIGSNYFGTKPPAGITMDKVVANFNSDMVGLGDGIGAPGALNFPEIWEKVIKRDQDPDVIAVVKPSTAGPGGSDYSTFITKGIESLALMTSGGVGHPDYHDSGDDTYKIDPEILRKTAQFVIQGTINTANETAIALLVPDRQYLYNSLMMRFTNINIALPGAAWKNSDFPTKAALLGKIYEREVTRSAQEAASASNPSIASILSILNIVGPSAPATGQPVRKDLAIGVRSAAFGGDVKFLDLAAATVGFGRVDWTSDDGFWVVNGRLTDSGKAALKIMEADGITANLINPGEALLTDVLTAAAKPLVVSGTYALTPAIKDLAVSKKAVLSVDYDPEDVDGSVEKADQAKKLAGAANSLVVFAKSADKLNDLAAKRAFYFGLIKKGWKTTEIDAIVGGSLRPLMGVGGMYMR